ncbi:TPA: hypothetical protein MJE06_26655 [Klebsiella pneumoniae]|nr:hypothetical protein [Escherichia coli]EFN8054954.1 hypothetical protein [Escherichia coli]HBX6183645.1 hypothetical protein [Klebsiella pneumoniae]HBY9696181.1 hypothetical protein [Klebsiella pneumoniae]HBZ1276100.1 hypothetical protein [Klebsiella pneumoniae]
MRDLILQLSKSSIYSTKPLQRLIIIFRSMLTCERNIGNDSNLLIVFYVQIMPDDFVMQLHRF